MKPLRMHIGLALPAPAAIAFALPAHADVRALPARPPVVTGSTAATPNVAAASEARDNALAERVMRALADDPALEGAAITVLVDHGNVSLSGTSEDDDQADYATKVAQEAAGPTAHVASDNLQPALTAPLQ
jgi:osmotically-inducible protein OsmY